MRILHCPLDTGGQAWMLSRAERSLGYHSDNVIFFTSKFGYKSDKNLALERKNKFFQIVLRLVFFLKSLFKYDVFHFYFGTSLLPRNLDLPILKLIGKKIFFTFQGCDIRLKEGKLHKDSNEYIIRHNCNCNIVPDKEKIKKVNFINKYSKKTFVLNPDLLLASPSSEMLPYASVDLNYWKPEKEYKLFYPKKPLIFMHAPTDRKIKGTKYIIEAVNRLKKERFNVDLIILEKLKHKKIKSACQKADIIIDQLIIGWYGGYAVEMMALGKPVVCYLDKRFSHLVPYYKKIPIINANKKNIYFVLKKIIENPKRIRELAKKSRDFVEEIHNPAKIAESMINNYKYANRKT